jgi:hypothetical protein
VELLEHPLFIVAAEQYPTTPLEKATILPFFHKQLRAFGVRNENQCPADDLALVEWVERAWRWGRRLRHRDRQRVKSVIAEVGPTEFAAIAEIAEEVLRKARSRRPLDLTRAIFEWHQRVYRWTIPGYYGQALDRIVHCTDLAIWAALV